MVPQVTPFPVIDLFAGPGGLGEGFASLTGPEHEYRFKLRLSVEKDRFAYETLRLRSFYRQFPRGRCPASYYDVLRGTIPAHTLFQRHEAEAERADAEVWHAELSPNNHTAASAKIRSALSQSGEWVLIGGPPCQAYSVAGRSRNKGVHGYRADRDLRQYLYAEYLEIIAALWPAVFVMENVKGLLSATLRNRGMFDRILEDLEEPSGVAQAASRTGRTHKYQVFAISPSDSLFGGQVGDFVVKSELHGVPQARHRVILVGVRDDLPGLDPRDVRLNTTAEASVGQVLDGLPPLRSGLSRVADSSAAWRDTLRGARDRRWVRSARKTGGDDVEALICSTLSSLVAPDNDRGCEFLPGDFQPSYRPDWFHDPKLDGVCNHATREHMEADLFRYLYASCFARCRGYSPKLRHFPVDLLPKHSNVQSALDGAGFFADRFRVQVRHRPATTITSHVAKDGHGFIHFDPAQCRSLTVREAARLQTFPDNYYFAGPKTQQYHQVGNAVPPLLANQIAQLVWRVLVKGGVAS